VREHEVKDGGSHLHVTLLRSKQSARNGVDCSELLSEFGNYYLCEVSVDRMHISSRADLEENGNRMQRNKWPKDHAASFACEKEIKFTTEDKTFPVST
jgi:hypothetical protein